MLEVYYVTAVEYRKLTHCKMWPVELYIQSKFTVCKCL